MRRDGVRAILRFFGALSLHESLQLSDAAGVTFKPRVTTFCVGH